jgi:hypothetical protein
VHEKEFNELMYLPRRFRREVLREILATAREGALSASPPEL